MMRKTYILGVRELHTHYYSVKADDPEQAKALVNDRAPGVTDEWEEFDHELKPDTWSVEEGPTKQASSMKKEGGP
jgi:hypothetical protein